MRNSAFARAGAFFGWPGLSAAAAALLVPAAAWAAAFKTAPSAEKDAAEESDMILGLIHTNTLFFIALAVFGVYWFLFGGGRKPKVGRTGH